MIKNQKLVLSFSTTRGVLESFSILLFKYWEIKPIEISWIDDRKNKPITSGASPNWKVSQ